MTQSKAYKEGYDAYEPGEDTRSNNPYEMDDPRYIQWAEGNADAMTKGKDENSLTYEHFSDICNH